MFFYAKILPKIYKKATRLELLVWKSLTKRLLTTLSHRLCSQNVVLFIIVYTTWFWMHIVGFYKNQLYFCIYLILAILTSKDILQWLQKYQMWCNFKWLLRNIKHQKVRDLKLIFSLCKHKKPWVWRVNFNSYDIISIIKMQVRALTQKLTSSTSFHFTYT